MNLRCDVLFLFVGLYFISVAILQFELSYTFNSRPIKDYILQVFQQRDLCI